MTTISPLAGKPAPASMLVNLPRLVTAYSAEDPDPAVAAERVAFGTSGHRGSALERTFNEAHILAITQAIRAYRQAHRIDGPLFLGMDTHALSEPALGERPRGAGRQRRRRDDRPGLWLHADAGHFARDPLATTAVARTGLGGRHRHHTLAQPARRRGLQIQSSDSAARPTPTLPAGLSRRANVAPGPVNDLRSVRRMPLRARSTWAAGTHLHDDITSLRRRPRGASSTWPPSARRCAASAWIRSGGAACTTGEPYPRAVRDRGDRGERRGGSDFSAS